MASYSCDACEVCAGVPVVSPGPWQQLPNGDMAVPLQLHVGMMIIEGLWRDDFSAWPSAVGFVFRNTSSFPSTSYLFPFFLSFFFSSSGFCVFV